MPKKRSDGKYQRQITIGTDYDGNRVRKTIYANTLKELEEKSNEIKRQMRLGIVINDDTNFFGLYSQYKKFYKPATRANAIWFNEQMRRVEKYIIPELGNRPVQSLSKLDFNSIFMDMASVDGLDLSTSTIRDVKIASSQILELGVDKKILLNNVAKGAVVPKKDSKDIRPLTDYEVELVEETYNGHKMGLFAMIETHCGLRRGEILALNISDIDLKNKMVSVSKSIRFDSNDPFEKYPKTKFSFRNVPMPDILYGALKDTRFDHNMLFPSATGAVMTKAAFRSAWRSYETHLNIEAGGYRGGGKGNKKIVILDHITTHMLRHTYASTLYDAGVDILTMQKRLGHESVETTLKVYTKLSA